MNIPEIKGEKMADSETSDSSSEYQSSEKYDPNDLPIIVWLRGDESFLPEFELDADDAMKLLGIKRSRLTQISGKELRVGRIKAGRYIKPLYRKVDIEEYIKWTRPTASHQSSKKALESVSKKIEHNLSEIGGMFDEKLEAKGIENKQLADRLFTKGLEEVMPIFEKIVFKIHSLKEDLVAESFNSRLILSKTKSLDESLEKRFNGIYGELNSLSLDLEKISKKIIFLSKVEEKIDQNSNNLSKKMLEIKETLLNNFSELYKKNNSDLESMVDKINGLLEVKNKKPKKLKFIKPKRPTAKRCKYI